MQLGVSISVVEGLLTIDELAREAGTTTRNIRAYQTRGLLPSPTLRGRVGYYDDGHLARLRLIGRLQERGFSLAAVDELLKAWEERRDLGDVLGFEEVLTAPWTNEREERMTREELNSLFPALDHADRLLERAMELELLIPDGDDFRVPAPSLLRMGAELFRMGIPLSSSLDVAAKLEVDAGRVARDFVELFEKHVWEPFIAEGMPPERLPEVTSTLRRLRPMASAAVGVALGRAMEREVAAATMEQMLRTEVVRPTRAPSAAS
jgi:DNA-binding transcriptional MerR regulator